MVFIIYRIKFYNLMMINVFAQFPAFIMTHFRQPACSNFKVRSIEAPE